MIEADLKRYLWRNWTIFSGYFVSTLNEENMPTPSLLNEF